MLSSDGKRRGVSGRSRNRVQTRIIEVAQARGDTRTAKVQLELKLAVNIKVSVPPDLAVKEQMRKM